MADVDVDAVGSVCYRDSQPRVSLHAGGRGGGVSQQEELCCPHRQITQLIASSFQYSRLYVVKVYFKP